MQSSSRIFDMEVMVSHGDSLSNVLADGPIDTSIEILYESLCDMQSSDQSVSRQSFRSVGEESQIDSELRHLVGGDAKQMEIVEEHDILENEILSTGKDGFQLSNSKIESSTSPQEKKQRDVESESSLKSILKEKNGMEKTSSEMSTGKMSSRTLISRTKYQSLPKKTSKSENANLDLGRYLLKQARDLFTSGDSHYKALELSLRASKIFEAFSKEKPTLELVTNLHLTAAIYCSIGRNNEAIPILQRAIDVAPCQESNDHALAKFAGYMQLGDIYTMLGEFESSSRCYLSGLQIQKKILGENDLQVCETYRYLAEAYFQALQFDEAEKLCQISLEIQKKNDSQQSLEEAADRRLMGLICETKGNHEEALEHLLLASMAMAANGQEAEVASVDCSIGDAYLHLSKYDEAALSYQKALASFKKSKGENSPSVGSVFVRLADLHSKTGNIKESKLCCENALSIFEITLPGIYKEEIASGFISISAIYESMNELDQATKLLQKALKLYSTIPGQQTAAAVIEVQIAVIHYMQERFSDSYNLFKVAILKLRSSGEKESAYLGIIINQMGLSCMQLRFLHEAAELFEEAKGILEQNYGLEHPQTLGVYSNLAGAYDALGRLEEAIQLLEHIVDTREGKLGTAGPDGEDEKRRLLALMKEAGKSKCRKSRSLETLLDANYRDTDDGLVDP